MSKNKNKKFRTKRVPICKFEQKKTNKEVVKAASDQHSFVTDWQIKESE